MMSSRAAKLLLAIAVCAGLACGVPAGAQTLKTEPDANQLACGQKVLVENNTSPTDQILEVTGSCLRIHLQLMQALKTQFLQHLVEGRLALQICCGSRAKKLMRVRDRALPSGPVDFPPPRRRHAGTGFHHHRKVGPLKAAVQRTQCFIAGAATDDGARSFSWRAI